MAKIQPPVLPSRLYRYRRIRDAVERELETITKGFLWASPFHKLNDPMEGFYSPSAELKGSRDFKAIVAQIFQGKAQMGITSFSDTRESELLWTHYADNYAGICVEYDTQILMNALPDDARMVRLGYGDEPPSISRMESSERTAVRILSQKKSNWSYEREWRVLTTTLGRTQLYSRNCVTNVYLGSRISRSDKREIVKRLSKHSIKIFETVVKGYKHQWRKIDSETDSAGFSNEASLK